MLGIPNSYGYGDPPPRMLKGKSPRKGNERFLVGHHHTGWLVLFLYPAPPSFLLFLLLSPAFFWFRTFFSFPPSTLPLILHFLLSFDSPSLFSLLLLTPHYIHTLYARFAGIPLTSRPTLRPSVYFHQLPLGIERASSL